ncbi:hypothetical protein RIR_jg34686.t1 [Rhizophagus irregularis DAOM 181602=DAOM 197198]|nr:hypothetical protein RIR_jg34686.t1 [Rhizophagus irregularis DAOM 181602=DAOM 197198]
MILPPFDASRRDESNDICFNHANVILDFQNRQLTIPLSSHKKITIPISLHKQKTNVTSLQMDTIDLKKIHTLEED